MATNYFKTNLENATHIEIKLMYDEGGYKIGTGKVDKRGFYLFIEPVTIEENFITHQIFNGYKYFIKESQRNSKKTLEKIENLMSKDFEKLAIYFKENKNEEIINYIDNLNL